MHATGRREKVTATTRTAPASRSARAQAESVAPVVSTSSTSSALRGTAPGRMDPGGLPSRRARRRPTWRPDAARAPGSRVAAGGRCAPPAPRRSQRPGRSREPRAQARGRHRHDLAAQRPGRRQPVDPLRHQRRHPQQPAELERGDEVAGDAFVRRRGPGALDAGRAARSAAAAPPPAAGRSARTGSASPAGQGRPHAAQSGGTRPATASSRNPMPPILTARGARVVARHRDKSVRDSTTGPRCRRRASPRPARSAPSSRIASRQIGAGADRAALADHRPGRRCGLPPPTPTPAPISAGASTSAPSGSSAAHSPAATSGTPGSTCDRPAQGVDVALPAARRGCRCRSSRRRSRASRRGCRPRAAPGRHPSPSRRSRAHRRGRRPCWFPARGRTRRSPERNM